MTYSGNFSITLENHPSPDDVQAVRDGLYAFNRARAGDDDHRELVLLLRDSGGRTVGGLLGDTYWGWLHVGILWLEDGFRRQGHGTRLLAAAEAEAAARGCLHAHLDTMDFQALPFYEKHGYAVWGTLADMPAGHKRYFLRKELA